MPTKEMQTDITSHMRKLIKREHGCDESDVPYGIPCTPEEWTSSTLTRRKPSSHLKRRWASVVQTV